MVQFAMVLLTAFAGGDGDNVLEYEAAFKKAQQEEKPLLIVVGANWCASCQLMKRDTIKPMRKAGKLKDVVLTIVDKDKRPELAEKLMHGETLPQIVVYSKENARWKRYSLTGMQSTNRMAELLGRVLGRSETIYR